MVKNLPANTGDTRDSDSVPGSGRYPGVENGNPIQYSCLGNPMDRGAWWATIHGVTKSQTCLRTAQHFSVMFRNFTLICCCERQFGSIVYDGNNTLMLMFFSLGAFLNYLFNNFLISSSLPFSVIFSLDFMSWLF